MPRRILNHVSTTITGAALLMGAASLLSRLLGLLRDRIFAHYFGAGDILDAYYAAFKIPDLLFNLVIVGALSAGFIPIFTKYLKTHGKDASFRIVHTTLTLAGFVLAIAGIILAIFASPLVSLIAPGFEQGKHELTVQLTRIMFLSPFLLGLSAVLGGVLQSIKRFFVFALAPILYNIGIIIGATVFYPLIGLSGLAWGVVLGALMHFALQYASTHQAGLRPQFSLAISKEVRKIGALMVPRTLGLAISQVSLIALTAIASTLASGSIAIFQFAHNIAFVPIGIFAVSYAVAAFPSLSEGALNSTSHKFVQQFSSTTRQILFLMIPSTVIFLLLRAQIVRVLLGTGQFDWEDTMLTFETLGLFVIGFAAIGLVQLLVRGFYAYEDTKTPVTIAVIAEAIVIGTALIASKKLGVPGIALGVSVGALIQVILLTTFLYQKTKNLDGRRIAISLTKMTIAAYGMARVMQFLKGPVAGVVDMTTGIGVLTQATVVTIVGALVYIAVGLALNTHEMRVFVDAVRARLIRRKHLPTDITDIGRVE